MIGRLAVVALAGLVAAACAADDATSDVAETVPTDRRTAAVAATTTIETTGCGPRPRFGVGTVVDDSLVVTAAHVVAGAELVEVVDGTGTSGPADIVWFDPDGDVAALRVDRGLPPAAALRSEPVEGGEAGVVVLADGEVLDVEVGAPVTIRTTDIYLQRDVERDGFKVDADVVEGDSGAMVHLTDGGVGIVWARSNITAGQAWAVELPPELLDADRRDELRTPLGSGECP